ncbi:unnamed protein product [Rotaria sp. Silwood1]|nr:unnamed protein product [Rotaria sp. Silwood1]CAF1631463.1 unnamed protein product [Rotaria sp. Silwood1]
MLSHDTLHSKRVIKIQDLIKHYDSLLASGHESETHVIVNSVQIEDDKWKRLSRQIVDLLLAHLQSQVISNVLNYYDYHFISHYYYNGHILNMLDYTQEECWSSILTPSSSRIHLSISGQLQSYCDLIYHHELYVEHFTSITTHYQLLLLFFI